MENIMSCTTVSLHPWVERPPEEKGAKWRKPVLGSRKDKSLHRNKGDSGVQYLPVTVTSFLRAPAAVTDDRK